MRKPFPFALVAVLSVALNPAYAADPPKDDAGNVTVHKDDGVTAGPASPAAPGGDGTARVIILDQDGLQAIPNPYANPGPRMISDAWAMRT
jgi:hypothetical protein